MKLRIARHGQGRSGGYRTIVALVVDARAFYLFGYAKNDATNITDDALAGFRIAARSLQNVNDTTLDALVTEGSLREIAR